jgi:hypothetical protein
MRTATWHGLPRYGLMSAAMNADMTGPRERVRGAKGKAWAPQAAFACTRTRRATVRASAARPESCETWPALGSLACAAGLGLYARKGQRIRRHRKTRDAVSGRLDTRTILALRDRHWLPRKRRLPEECGACFRRREHDAARPTGMNVAWNVIRTFNNYPLKTSM